ncbi:MAG: hypothetical protein ACT4PJ_04860 [Gemmatimonadaceae bacterium]
MAFSACNVVDDVLEVEDPDVARPEALTGPEALPALVAGALSDFQVGYSGSSNVDGQITIVGLITDELYNSESFPTRIEIDQRRMRDDNGTLAARFLDMQQARAAAERAVRRFEEFDPGTVSHAQMHNLVGFSYTAFGENYCSGVPFSTLNDDGTITFGTPQTTDQMFETAISSFDAALGIVGSDTSAAARTQRHLAAVGKGRALLNLGDAAGATAAVANVPINFVYLIEHSTNSARQQNPVFTLVNVSRRFSVPESEGGNGIAWRSANDPRAPEIRNPVNPIGLDNETPSFVQLKYPSRGAAIPLATGIEAELIKAEGELQAGDPAGMLLILNNLRATRAPAGSTLPPLADPGTQLGREDLLFDERAFWLYLTAHRLGDFRRLIRNYGRDAETVFPTGEYHKSGALPYGPDVNFPLPDDEANNPNVSGGCLNRDA